MLNKEKGEKMKKTKLFSAIILSMLFLSIFPVIPKAFAAPTIYLVPSDNIYDTNTVYVGYTFNVTAEVSGTTQDIGGAQIHLVFDDSIINVTRWFTVPESEGGFMPEPITALPAPPDPNYHHVGPGEGYIEVAVNKGGLPPSAPWGHDGKIAIIEFIVTAIPSKLGKLNCALGIDNSATYLLDSTGSEISGVIKEDGYYELSWAKPAPANMGVKPTLTEYGPYPPSAVGEAFDIEVYIENLDQAWYLANATFDLVYNATVIDVLGDEANVTIAPLWGDFSVTFTRDPDPAVLDYITIYVGNPSSTPGGSPPADELVATITFTVMMQSEVPTVPSGYVDSSPLNFEDVELYDHVGPVDTAAPSNGVVNIYALISLPVPFFKVEPSYIELGPEPSIGEEFDVNVVITGPTAEGLHFAWHLIGVQFRLYYDPSVIEVVSIEEGPFLKDGPWNLHGTFFIASVESDGLGPHVMIGDMLLPNNTGYYDMTSWPNGTGTLVTIRFKALIQECPNNITSPLDLGPLFPGEWAIDNEGNWIPIDEASNVNGIYVMRPFSMPGTVIDLYGGAKNAGYWTGYPDPFPAPFGGQGQDQPMDLVIPQSEITLYASLTHNWWPVQSKEVSFEIEGPFVKNESDPSQLIPKYPGYRIWAKLTSITDSDGIATLVFRMPWPCDDPENITGIWLVTATARVGDDVVIDTMPFYYEYLVTWVKVSTDKYYYTHGECIQVTVEYHTHSMQFYPALFSIVLTDDMGVPAIMELYDTTVGGADWCTWKEDSFTVELCITKWTFAGYGYIHVNAFDKDPTEGGFAWCPEYSPAPEVQIGPY